MSGREASEPGHRGVAAVTGGTAGAESGTLVPERAAERRHNRVAEWLRRCATVVAAVARFVVARCPGPSWRRVDPAAGPLQSGRRGGARPLPEGSRRAPDSRRLGAEVRRLLADLGPTPGDVAASLEAAAVRGVPFQATLSPVGALLRAVVGADPDVEALTVRTDVVRMTVRRHRSPVTVPFPRPVRVFLAAFDVRCYPGLVQDARGRSGGR